MRPPESWKTARVTLTIVLIAFVAWLLVEGLGLGQWAAIWGGFVPARATIPEAGPDPWFWITPLTATLVHAGFVHVGFNMLILAFCGRAVEGVLGPGALAILYVVGAYAAAAGQFLVDPASPVPMVGASGAVSAVLGAYAILFGRNKVKVASPRLALLLHALWLLAAWVALNIAVGYVFGGLDIAVAVFAHIGGFLPGLLLAYPLLLFRYRNA